MTVAQTVAHEAQQRLTIPEERAIVKFCLDQDDRGFPPWLDMVKDMALNLERNLPALLCSCRVISILLEVRMMYHKTRTKQNTIQ